MGRPLDGTAQTIKSDTLRGANTVARVLEREESGWVQATYIDIPTRVAAEPEDLCLIRRKLFIYARTSVFGMRWKDYRGIPS